MHKHEEKYLQLALAKSTALARQEKSNQLGVPAKATLKQNDAIGRDLDNIMALV